MFGIKTDGFNSCIMFTPASHTIHHFQGEEKETIIIASSCDKIIIGWDSKSTDFLLMSLVPKYFWIGAIILNTDISIFTTCNNKVIGATDWSYSCSV